MLGKQALDTLAQPVVDIYNQLEQDMLTNIASKLKDNKDLLKTDPEAWKLQQMNYLGMLERENLNLIRKQAGLTAAEMNKILYSAAIDGMDQTDGALEKAIKDGAKLRVPKPIGENPQILTILKAFQEQAGNILNLTNQTMLKNSKKIYVDILNRSVTDVIAGNATPDQALRRTIGMWADVGVPALIDKAGRKWGAEGYVRTVIVTTTHNTVHQMQDQRFQEYGIDLVEVSSHGGARPLCAPYQGRIFSINGTTPKHPNLYTDTSYGQPAGLFGINCGHYKYPFIEGISTQTYFPHDEKENAQIYKESQQQRAIERSIRNAKTRMEMYKASGDEEGIKSAQALMKQRQGKMRDFIDETGRTRRRDREQIITKKVTAQDTPDTTTKLIKQKQKAAEKEIKAKEVTSGVPNPVTQDHIPQVVTPDKPERRRMDLATFRRITRDDTPDIEKNGEAISAMPKKDQRYVHKYTTNYYGKMNSFLRTGRNADDTELVKDVENLQRVIKDNAKPLSQDTILFRKIGEESIREIFNDEIYKTLMQAQANITDSITKANDLLVGGSLEDKAFVSSTYQEGMFGSDSDVNIHVYAPKGYKGGMFIESISEFSREKEYLFNSGMKFDIEEIDFSNRQITFKVIPQMPDASK